MYMNGLFLKLEAFHHAADYHKMDIVALSKTDLTSGCDMFLEEDYECFCSGGTLRG